MAELIQFPWEDDLDGAGMDRAALLEALASVRARLCQLDDAEPEDMTGEDYEAWADRHEALEDLADELSDRLDELGETE